MKTREGKVALILSIVAIAIVLVGMLGLETLFMSIFGYSRTEKEVNKNSDVVYRYINKDPALADTDFVEVHKIQDIAVSDIEERDGKIFRHTIGIGITEIVWVNEKDTDTPTEMSNAAWTYLWVKMVPTGILIVFVILIAICDLVFFVLYLYKQNNPDNDISIKLSFQNSLFVAYVVFTAITITLNAGFIVEHSVLMMLNRITHMSLRYKVVLTVCVIAMTTDIIYIAWVNHQYKKKREEKILKSDYFYNSVTYSCYFIAYGAGVVIPDYNSDLIWMMATLSMIARMIITICNHKIRTEEEVLIPVLKKKKEKVINENMV